MAPKKKKTKEQIAAEKAKLEEEARLAEEERLRQEEEARKVAEQLEQRRQQLLQDFEAAQNSRLQAERNEFILLLRQLQQERDLAAEYHTADKDWQRYLSCTHLPEPCRRPDMNDFLNSLAESRDEHLADTMKECESCVQLAKVCLMQASQAKQKAASAAGIAVLASGSADAGVTVATSDGSNVGASELVAKAHAASVLAEAQVAQYQADAEQLHELVRRKMDVATARILHCADEYADDKGDVLLTAQQGPLQWGLWVNTHKNPRFKLIDFGGLGMTVEIPKQLALASVALRVQRRPYNDTRQRSVTAAPSESGQAPACCLAPLGGVLQVDLLALSAPAKQSRGWSIRQVTPLSSNVAVVPYPIPPAGADLSTWQPDEEPPPLTFSVQLSGQLLVPANTRVGWWDEKRSVWSEEGVSGVAYDASSGRLSFSSVHLGTLALLQDTAAAVPYSSWTIRPTGGLGGTKATITIQVQPLSTSTSSNDGSQQEDENPEESSNGRSSTDVILEVGKGTITLLSPALPQLSHLLGQPMEPWQLLSACAECGLQLTPGSDEARVAGVQEKQLVMEGAMCSDLATICGIFLVASSRWNRAAGPDASIVRLSEVTDWEEGGRTAPEHAARIFKREVVEGDRKVLVVRRQGVQGVMFVNGGDNRDEPPRLHDFSSVEGIQAASKEPYCHSHASLHYLLSGPHEEIASHPAAQHLAATAAGLERIRATDPVFSETLQSVLQAMRLLTFG